MSFVIHPIYCTAMIGGHMTKTKVLFAYGGQSSEHEVSIASARNVFNALDPEKYEVAVCLIDKDGQWWLQESIGTHSEADSQLLPVLGKQSFVTTSGGVVLVP